ncbi:hypothetical protein FQN57_005104 [Myotisia sp. PD_48]|nr:hypothetical protein FQN57_005104 [Myotisia sp. PD_48]
MGVISGDAAETKATTGNDSKGSTSGHAASQLTAATTSSSTAHNPDTQAKAIMDTNDKLQPADKPAPVAASPKKRRKVNHDILTNRVSTAGDREPSKRTKNEQEPASTVTDTNTPTEGVTPNHEFKPIGSMSHNINGRDTIDDQILPDEPLSMQPPSLNPAQSAPSQDITTASGQAIDPNQEQLLGYNDWQLAGQRQFQDIHSFHPSYMFHAPEVTNEFNLLNDFLSNSLLDDGSMYPGDGSLYSDMSLFNSMGTNLLGNDPYGQQPQPSSTAPSQFLPPSQTMQGNSIQRPSSTVGNDKAKETYYMTAADPSGTDPPEERMNKLLKAKYDAGLLKPFNYVNGYARLNKYMEQHLQPASRQKILRQLDKFRPKFRERMQSLTDIELVLVEMWFERSLMEYDRVFASMAIPACLWRRTGQIFRGNKEMAQLIDVPIESLRDGKLAIHEIIVEDQLVSYWEKFGAIAFDSSQKAMLTSCTLKSPDPKSPKQKIPCCFSFTIRRDNHNM